MTAIIAIIKQYLAARATEKLFALAINPKKETTMFKGWKTIVVNVAAIAAFVLAYYGFDIEPSALEPMILAGVNLVLRRFTTTPMGQKE